MQREMDPSTVRPRTESYISNLVWRDNRALLKEYLNVIIFQYLYAAKLISESASLKFTDPKILEVDKIELIIRSVPKSGQPDYLVKFIDCLRESVPEAGAAHEQLADKLEMAYNKCKDDPTILFSHTVTTVYDACADVSTRSDSFTVTQMHKGSRINDGYVRGPGPAGEQVVPTLDVPVFRRNWKVVLCHSSAVIWVILGAILTTIFTQMPPIQDQHPAHIQGLNNDVTVDLGIDPFWLSAASFSAPQGRARYPCGSSPMYFVNNASCKQLPKITEQYNQSTFPGDPIYIYMLLGSFINATISLPADDDEFWIIKSISVYNNRKTLDCANYDNNSTGTKCFSGKDFQGQMHMISMMINTPDYYFFYYPLKQTTNPIVNFTLTIVTYNMTAVKDMYTEQPAGFVLPDTSNSIGLSASFDFGNPQSRCLILSTRCPNNTAYYNLMITDISRRMDIMLLPFVLGVIAALLQLTITLSVHCVFVKFYKPRARRKQSTSGAL